MRIPVALRRPLLLLCVVVPAFSGLSLRLGAQEKLVVEGDALKYFKGTDEPPAEWIQPSFDDSSWLDGNTPIGYSTDLTYKTLLSDMPNTYLTFYTRRKFSIPDVSALKAVKISMKYDDGFIAYMNGVEILRKNMNDGPATKDTAGLDHETNVSFEANFLACDALASANLQTGSNVFAVELHNVALTSSDCSLSFEVETASSVCPSALVCTLRPTGQVVLRWTKPASFIYDELSLYRNGVKIDPGPLKTAASYTDRTPVQGVNDYRLIAVACGTECSGADQLTCSVTVGGAVEAFRRGDTDDSGAVNLTDAVKLLSYLFRGEAAPACPDAADMDDDSSLKLTDAVYLLTALFRGGAAPPAPGIEACGPDPTADELEPCVYTHCP